MEGRGPCAARGVTVASLPAWEAPAFSGGQAEAGTPWVGRSEGAAAHGLARTLPLAVLRPAFRWAGSQQSGGLARPLATLFFSQESGFGGCPRLPQPWPAAAFTQLPSLRTVDRHGPPALTVSSTSWDGAKQTAARRPAGPERPPHARHASSPHGRELGLREGTRTSPGTCLSFLSASLLSTTLGKVLTSQNVFTT